MKCAISVKYISYFEHLEWKLFLITLYWLFIEIYFGYTRLNKMIIEINFISFFHFYNVVPRKYTITYVAWNCGSIYFVLDSNSIECCC